MDILCQTVSPEVVIIMSNLSKLLVKNATNNVSEDLLLIQDFYVYYYKLFILVLIELQLFIYSFDFAHFSLTGETTSLIHRSILAPTDLNALKSIRDFPINVDYILDILFEVDAHYILV